MNKIYTLALFLLAIICVTACSNKNIEHDVYINDIGYELNEELTIEVNLRTNNQNVTVCPIIKLEKADETNIKKIKESLDFSTNDVKFLNLYAKEFSEIYNDEYWSFETTLNNEDEVDLSNGDTIVKFKIRILEKGNYKISLLEKDTCEFKYNDLLYLNITTN